MFSHLKPTWCVPSLVDVDLEALRRKGVRAVLVDLDNTLATYDAPSVDRRTGAWLSLATALGIEAIVFSNNHEPRVETMAKALGLKYVADARKPLPRAYRRALSTLGYPPSQVAAIGDQLFTDVFGGNAAGLVTILVRPLGRQEFVGTRLVRPVEGLVLRGLGISYDRAGDSLQHSS